MECIVFHTVENKENPDYVEQNAPFLCSRTDAWLGKGYYFWETFIELAHWWGQTAYNNQYFICKSRLSCVDDELLDLVGNTDQIKEIRDITKELQKKYSKKLSVNFIIEWLGKRDYKFKAIRVHGINSISNEHITNWRFRFKRKNVAYLDLCPSIQICVLDTSVLTLPLEIVYPEACCSAYVV